MDDEQTCDATKTTTTAVGDAEVRCTKAPGHEDQGDDEHAGKHYGWPVRWRSADSRT